MVEGYAARFSCTAVVKTSDSMTEAIVGGSLMSYCLLLDPPWFNWLLSLALARSLRI